MLENITSSISNFNTFLMSQSSSWFITMGCYALAGFVFGFLIKYYLRYLIISILAVVLALWLLEYFSLITIQYENVQLMFGSSLNIFALISLATHWMRTHIAYSVSMFAGFLLAWLIG